MNVYCTHLILNVSPLISGMSIDDIRPGQKLPGWVFVDLDCINPDLKQLWTDLGLNLNMAGLFTLQPGESGKIHVDGTHITDIAKVNWSYGSTDHNMIWYQYKQGVTPPSHSVHHQGAQSRNYILCDPLEVEEVHRSPIGLPSLVQAGIPHTVKNISGVRKCLSIVLKDRENKFVPMKRAQEIFAQWIL